MKEIVTEIDIAAPAEHVWRLITDFPRYPVWNPFIREVIGEASIGSRLKVRIQPPGAEPITFRPLVTRAAAPHELRWVGRLGIPGLLDGEHIFEIESLADSRVIFLHRERFTGLLVAFLWPKLDTRTRQGFVEMNQALKKHAEEGGGF